MSAAVTSVSEEEWKRECGLVAPDRALYLPDCRALFARYMSVPGQALACPNVWVVLVECLGLLLDTKPQTHPTWEQNSAVGPQSRFYPTMRLLLTHHDTALRRLQDARCPPQACLADAVRVFCTPCASASGDQVLITVGVVASHCGEEAAVLCNLVENVLCLDKGAKTLILTARFNFAQDNERAHLGRLRASLKHLEGVQAALGRHEVDLVPLTSEQEAASHSLADVDVARIAVLIDRDFDLRTMLSRDMSVWWYFCFIYCSSQDEAHDTCTVGLTPPQFLAVAVLQLCVGLALRMEARRGDDEATPMLSRAAAAHGEPTALDTAYWAACDAKDGEALLFSLPPFHCSSTPTWGSLLQCVSHDSTHLNDALQGYRPSYGDLQLKHRVLRKAEAAWNVAADRLMHSWEKRNKWCGLRTVHNYGHSHSHLIRPVLWLEASLALYEPFGKKQDLERDQAEAEAQVALLRSTTQQRECSEAFKSLPRDDSAMEKSDLEMRVTGRDHASFKVALLRNGDSVEVSVPPRASQLTPTEMLPHYGPLACATDVSGVPLTNEQILWVFRSLDTNNNGTLDRDEVASFYQSCTMFDTQDDTTVKKELQKLIGSNKKVGPYEFKTMLLHIAKA